MARPDRPQKALARVALGAAAVLLHGIAIGWLLRTTSLWTIDVLEVRSLAQYRSLVGYYSLRFAAGYALHAGIASLMIGSMRMLGFELRERFHYPFLADSPAEFWRRWNVYVGTWFRRYVFMPTALAARRRVPHGRIGLVAAVMVTFVAGGIAHEYVLYAQHGKWQLGAAVAFTFQGIALLAFALAGLGGGSAVQPRAWSNGAATRFVGRTVGRIVFLHVLLITHWIALPAFSGHGLPASLGARAEAVVDPSRVQMAHAGLVASATTHCTDWSACDGRDDLRCSAR